MTHLDILKPRSRKKQLVKRHSGFFKIEAKTYDIVGYREHGSRIWNITARSLDGLQYLSHQMPSGVTDAEAIQWCMEWQPAVGGRPTRSNGNSNFVVACRLTESEMDLLRQVAEAGESPGQTLRRLAFTPG